MVVVRSLLRLAALLPVIALASLVPVSGLAQPAFWQGEWPKTDFSRHSVPFDEIMSGGPPKDGIPAIDEPRFVSTAEMKAKNGLAPSEPVVALTVNGESRAYPLRILIWHEIVNDTLGGVPVTVTYCPLCNSAVAFDRRVAGRVLDFGTTGKLRRSDLVMYDRQTESWWQQFVGEGIVGAMTGVRLTMLPARVESFSRFAARAPDGKVLVPTGDVRRDYGRNPYAGYDRATEPFLYRGDLPKDIPAMAYVLAVGDEAWTLDLLRRKGRIEAGELVITWESGQNSALDTAEIARGRDIGNIVVQRRTPKGLVDAVHDLTFAFVFHTFRPGGTIHR
jgi:hypothetical protein